MKKTTLKSYRARLIRVIDYMYQHIEDNLDVNTLADVALMSPYHFHRIYRELARENINSTVRRLRLQHAASALIRSDVSLPSIAKQVAYGSAEAFSRAFSKEFGESPSEYRLSRQGAENRQPFVATLPNAKQEYSPMYEVKITDFSGVDLIALEHRGDYMNISQVFEKLAILAGNKGLFGTESRWFGIYYHDPKTVEEKTLRAHACLSLHSDTPLETDLPIERIKIQGGKCATLLFKGAYAELEKPYDWFFGQWLPRSGYEAADFPCFEEYLNDAKTTPPSDLLTNIHCLLK